MVLIKNQNVHNKWNERNLVPPPVTTYKVNNVTVDITGLRTSFERAIHYFENQAHFESDIALLSRTIFRMKNKFRTDKGFKFMQKLNRTLRKYSEVNFLSVMHNFYGLLPEVVRPGVYLPTNNMLDYVIVRLQGLAALMHYTAETAKMAAHLMEERVAIGHFWKVAFFAYALVSRIWFLCNDIIEFCYEFYNEIIQMRNILGSRNSWVGDDYIFPSCLKGWLNIQQTKTGSALNELNKTYTEEEVHNESDIEFWEGTDNKQSERIAKSEPITTEVPKQKSAFELLLEDEEMGEVITDEFRKTPVKIVNEKKKRNKDKAKKKMKDESDVSSLQLIESINSFKLLKLFLKKETKLRLTDRNQCVYKKLDGLQWNMLQNNVKSLSKKAAENEDKHKKLLSKAIKMLKSGL